MTMFEHLGDPHPPAPDDDARAAVGQRAQGIRRRQRVARSVMVCAAVVLLGGGFVAIGHRGAPAPTATDEITVANTDDTCCGIIEGRVTDGRGPVDRVVVSLLFTPLPGSQGSRPLDAVANPWRVKTRTFTDTDGTFRFTDLERGAYVVRYVDRTDPLERKIKHQPAFFGGAVVASEATPIAVAPHQTARADATLELSPVYAIKGVAREASTGYPIAGITVRLFIDGELTRETTSSNLGDYDFGGVPAGSYTIAFVDQQARGGAQGGPFAVTWARDHAVIEMPVDARADLVVDGSLRRR